MYTQIVVSVLWVSICWVGMDIAFGAERTGFGDPLLRWLMVVFLKSFLCEGAVI